MNISRTMFSNDLYILQIFSSFWEANVLRVQYTVIHVTYIIFQLN